MERGGSRGAAGQHEAPELGKLGVEPVAVRLEPVDERLLDPEPALDVRGHGEVGTEVEELILDAFEDSPDLIGHVSGEHDPDGRVELVHGAVPGDARIALRDARPIAERRLPRVAAAGVDPVEAYRLVLRAWHGCEPTPDVRHAGV